MFSIPLERLTISDVQSFCAQRPREGVVLDYKCDFPKRLDKAIAAFANTQGGILLIGVNETATGEPELPLVGVPLEPGLRERVLATALDSIHPPVFPEVKVLEFASPSNPAPDRAIVFIRVHESDSTPHAVDSGKSVYRRVDSISEQFVTRATVEHIEWLANKRKKSLQLKADLVSTAESRADAYLRRWRSHFRRSTANPLYKSIISITPRFPRDEIATALELLQLCREKMVSVAGRDFPSGSPVPVSNGVRFPDTYTNNYFYVEVSRFGLIYIEVGSTRDEHTGFADSIIAELVAYLIVASLKYAAVMYKTCGYFGLVDFRCQITPTLNRYPFISSGLEEEHHYSFRTLESSINLESGGTVKELSDSLVEIASRLQQEFYWAFGMNLNLKLVENQLLNWRIV